MEKMMKFLILENHYQEIKDVHSILMFETICECKPYFSIMIPTYQRANVLKDAIYSALHQIDISNFEIVIIDNEIESNTDTEKVVKQFINEYPNIIIRYYKNIKNIGMVGNWNRCIELARGEWIVILHDDDMLHPLFLWYMSQYTNRPDIDLIASESYMLQDNKLRNFYEDLSVNKRSHSLAKLKVRNFFWGNSYLCCGVSFRRSSALALGGFSAEDFPKINTSPDYIFWVQMCLWGKSYKLNRKISLYRLSNFSGTAQLDNGFYKFDFILKEELYELLGVRSIINSIWYALGIVKQLLSIKRKYKIDKLSKVKDLFGIQLRYKNTNLLLRHDFTITTLLIALKILFKIRSRIVKLLDSY